VIGIRWLVTSLGSGLLLGRESRGDLTDRIIYGRTYESSPIVDNSSRSSLPTKPQKVFQPLQGLSNTYYERMEPIQSSLPNQYQPSSGH
jgi:hypothetical protein